MIDNADISQPRIGPVAWNEADRLYALRSYNIVDSQREQVFDDFVQVAQVVCGTELAMINLLEADRQWAKAASGRPVHLPSREASICLHTLHHGAMLEIRDCAEDPRFADSPIVRGAPHLRYYAGVPLITEGGLPIGALCVLDSRPRPEGLTPEQRHCLETLGRQVMVQMEMRRALEERTHAEAALTVAHNRIREILGSIEDPFFVVNAQWRVMFANNAVMTRMERPAAEVIGQDLLSMFPTVADFPDTDGMRRLQEAMDTRRSSQGEVWSAAFGSWCDMAVYPMADGGLAVYVKLIEGRRRLEAELSEATAQVRDTLAEKDLLMLETHHRVKNSLQMVQSLLTLQARNVADPDISHMLRESASRVRTFGALHEALYQIADGAEVDIRSYFEKLVADLNDGMASTFIDRPIKLECPSWRWPAADVSTLGLVLTELVTNALKYGEGVVRVRFAPACDGMALLTVEDEGRGLSEDFDPDQTNGLGMRLVRRLLRDRNARLEVDRSVPQTRMAVTLPVPAMPGSVM